jgi:hypothetical protein
LTTADRKSRLYLILYERYERQATSDKQQATSNKQPPKNQLLFIMEGEIDSIREVLSGRTIWFDKLEDTTGIFDQVDAFVNLSRDNKTVQEVTLYLATDPDAHRYVIWDKIAEGIGNLQALDEILIMESTLEDDEGDPIAPDWEILACILRRLRRGVQLRMRNESPLLLGVEALPAFAAAIHGHAMITEFSTGDSFHFDCLDILCSALLTLPALENILFEHDDDQGPVEAQSLESMVKLLQSPSLREVEFEYVVFTNTLCQAVANVLKERSEITRLCFLECSFPEGGGAMIARALKTNTALKYLQFDARPDEVFWEVLAAALLSNSTLSYISLDGSGSCSWLSPLFLALQLNTGLKELRIDGIELIDEKLSTAMRLGLAKNSTLETLTLPWIKEGDNDMPLWLEALSFLRTNSALKTLDISFKRTVTNSRVATIRMEVLAMLRENESLESLFMVSMAASMDAWLEDYLVVVAAIHPNTTLKNLRVCDGILYLDENEKKDLISVIKKNYGLEEILEFRHGHEYSGDIRSIFDLNRAGRRYLVQDGSSISKGVAVLSCVSNTINSVFLHLLENPRLCDRSAVEISSIGNVDVDNATGGSTPRSSGNRHSGEKREQQAPSHPGKESHRRLE